MNISLFAIQNTSILSKKDAEASTIKNTILALLPKALSNRVSG